MLPTSQPSEGGINSSSRELASKCGPLHAPPLRAHEGTWQGEGAARSAGNPAATRQTSDSVRLEGCT